MSSCSTTPEGDEGRRTHLLSILEEASTISAAMPSTRDVDTAATATTCQERNERPLQRRASRTTSARASSTLGRRSNAGAADDGYRPQ